MQRGSPGLEWRATIDRDKAAVVGGRCRATHPKVEWRDVYQTALSARREQIPVPQMIESCAKATGARPGDISNFLISTTLAIRR